MAPKGNQGQLRRGFSLLPPTSHESRQAAECNRGKGEARAALRAQRDPHAGVQRDFLKLGFCIQNAPFTQPGVQTNLSIL